MTLLSSFLTPGYKIKQERQWAKASGRVKYDLIMSTKRGPFLSFLCQPTGLINVQVSNKESITIFFFFYLLSPYSQKKPDMKNGLLSRCVK